MSAQPDIFVLEHFLGASGRSDRHAVHFSSENQAWETPPEFFDRLNEEFRLQWDACAVEDTAKLGPDSYYGPDRPEHYRDALVNDWDRRMWMNPPYGRELPVWTAKAADECERGCPIVVGLVPARTDTRWWHEHVMRAHEVRLVRGRIRFVGGESCAPFPSAVVIWSHGYRPGDGPVFTTMEARP